MFPAKAIWEVIRYCRHSCRLKRRSLLFPMDAHVTAGGMGHPIGVRIRSVETVSRPSASNLVGHSNSVLENGATGFRLRRGLSPFLGVLRQHVKISLV